MKNANKTQTNSNEAQSPSLALPDAETARRAVGKWLRTEIGDGLYPAEVESAQLPNDSFIDGMNSKDNISSVRFAEVDEESISLVGDLNEQNVSAFSAEAATLAIGARRSITLNLYSFDIDDGVALATCINVLRELRGRVNKLVLRGAPQILGHNLYRVGMLDGSSAIELVEMRLDEPSGF